jgi:hypothetical protein
LRAGQCTVAAREASAGPRSTLALANGWRLAGDVPRHSWSECGNLAATLLIVQAGDLLASDHSPQRAASLALVLDLGYDAAALDRSASRR